MSSAAPLSGKVAGRALLKKMWTYVTLVLPPSVRAYPKDLCADPENLSDTFQEVHSHTKRLGKVKNRLVFQNSLSSRLWKGILTIQHLPQTVRHTISLPGKQERACPGAQGHSFGELSLALLHSCPSCALPPFPNPFLRRSKF